MWIKESSTGVTWAQIKNVLQKGTCWIDYLFGNYIKWSCIYVNWKKANMIVTNKKYNMAQNRNASVLP